MLLFCAHRRPGELQAIQSAGLRNSIWIEWWRASLPAFRARRRSSFLHAFDGRAGTPATTRSKCCSVGQRIEWLGVLLADDERRKATCSGMVNESDVGTIMGLHSMRISHDELADSLHLEA